MTAQAPSANNQVPDLKGRARIERLDGEHEAHVHLLRAELDDPEIYMRIVRDELERTSGRPRIDWPARHYKGRVRRGRPNPDGSLFHLANHYQALGEQEKRTYWIGKQASLMEKKLFEHPATMLEGLLRRGRPGRLPAAQASLGPSRGTGQERKRRLEECCDATT